MKFREITSDDYFSDLKAMIEKASTDFKVGTQIIAIKECGSKKNIPINSIGIIYRLNRKGNGFQIFCKFVQEPKNVEYCGTITNPFIAIYSFRLLVKQTNSLEKGLKNDN